MLALTQLLAVFYLMLRGNSAAKLLCSELVHFNRQYYDV